MAAPATADGQVAKVCVSKKGVMRIPKDKCKKSERSMTIVVSPPAAGPKGEPGAAGAAGPAGPKGDPGPAGSPDTAAQVLTKLLTVDGPGSGLDAELLAGTPLSGLQRRGTRTVCGLGQAAVGLEANGDLTCALRSPFGSAGGDLYGGYPDPTLAPVPAVRLTKASSPTLNNGDEVLVRWGGIDYEQGGDLFKPATATGADCATTPDACRLYAPESGIYEISAGVAWSDSDDQVKSRSLAIRLIPSAGNPRDIAFVQSPQVKELFAWDQQTVSTQIRLNAGDYVTAKIGSYQTGTATLEPNQDRTFFAMTWVSHVG